jgi:hypothetical protein
MINEILLRRRNKVTLCTTYVITEDPHYEYVFTIMKNVQNLGYTFSKELIEKLAYMDVQSINKFYINLISALKGLTGADVQYDPFYPNFPEQVMEASDVELFMNAIIHYWSNGRLLPEYVKEERLPLFDNPDLIVLELGENKELDEILNNLISSKTSLSVQDKEDIVTIFNEFGFTINALPDAIPFKENLVVIAKIVIENTNETLWYPILSKYFKTATDVLRLATELSGGDTSLAANTKYISFKRPTRALLLMLLENCNSIEEDMKRYQMNWIKLGEKLHPGEYKQYIKVNTAFDKLRNGGKIDTFASKVEECIKTNNIKSAVEILEKRPGEFARRLDVLLRSGSRNNSYIITKFSNVAEKISIPVLLQVKEHFAYRCNDSDSRIFFPKGMLTKGYVIKNELAPIGDNLCESVVNICERAIINQLSEKENIGKVFISNSMKGYCVPQSQRSASSGNKIITRGSRLPINKDFVRLFIRWENEVHENGYEERTDVDLSCSFLNENYQELNTVTYYDLRNNYSCHSGDYTNAPRPNGACEFIDIDIKQAIENEARYAVVQVYGYTYSKFCNLDGLYAGWMERNDLNSGEVFEPSTVQNKIDLTGNTMCMIPMVFDLLKKEVVWMDMALTTQFYFSRNTANNIHGVALSVKGIVEGHKPQMYDLIQMNAKARGTITEDRNDADIIFDTDTTKPIEKVIVEVQNDKGEIIETRVEERVKEDVNIVTPFDIDIFMGDLM